MEPIEVVIPERVSEIANVTREPRDRFVIGKDGPALGPVEEPDMLAKSSSAKVARKALATSGTDTGEAAADDHRGRES